MENSETSLNNLCRSPSVHQKNREEYEDLSRNDNVDNIVNEDDEAQGSRSLGTKGGAQGWRNVRAVMAYYCTLRKIKRNV